METTVKKSNTQSINPQKRLSKVGQWLRDNPDGIFVVLDRRAVNK